MHFTAGAKARCTRRILEAVENLQPRVIDGIGVIVGVGLRSKGLASLPIEALDLPGRGLDHINGTLVQGECRAGIIDFGNDFLLAAGDVDDHEVAVGYRAEAHTARRIAVRHPVPAIPLTVQHPLLFGVGEHLDQVFSSECFVRSERQFEGGAANVVHQDQQLVRSNARVFRRRTGEEGRVANNVLVQRLAGGDEDPQ